MIKCLRFKILIPLLLVISTWAHADSGFSRLYVFGDSLSDTGNLASVIGDFPSPPYYMNRVSNGPVAVEVLAQKLDLAADPSLHLIGVATGTNYAVAGANAYGDEAIDLNTQLIAFLANHGYMAPADALYVIMIGGNDVRTARDSTVLTAQTIVTAAANQVRQTIEALSQAGARSFLVINSPNIGIIPETGLIAQAIGNPALVQYATQLSKQYRVSLHHEMKRLKHQHDLNVMEFDLFKFFNKLVKKAAVLGFTNTSDACFSSVSFSFHPECNYGLNFDSFIFFDEIHPTARTHEIVGDAFYRAVKWKQDD